MKLSLQKTCAALIALSVQTAFAAANFSITPLEDVALPNAITLGQTVVAYYVVTNKTNQPLNGYSVSGLPRDIVITDNTAPNYYNCLPMCSDPVNLAEHDSCLLQLDITGPINSNFALCKGNSCTTASEPLRVEKGALPEHARYAYVTQYSNDVAVQVCEVNHHDHGLEECKSAGGGAILQGLRTSGIQIGNGGSTAYLTAEQNLPYTFNIIQNYAYQCPIYANTGMFGTCTETEIVSPSGYNPGGAFLALNTDSTMAFLPTIGLAKSLVGNATGVLACPIASNTIGGYCTDTGVTNLGQPIGITLNATNTLAFIGSYDEFVTTCQVSGTSFTNCGHKTGDDPMNPLFGEAIAVALNKTGTILYVTDNSNGFVYGCDTSTINTSTNTFSSCFEASDKFTPQPWGLALNTQNSVAYLTFYSDTVSACSILPNGHFDTCVTTDAGTFDQAIDIALFY
ncbi:MAG: hypothetical protein WC627_03755 [Legionella sp.]|jgi:hypothetical protein